MSFRYGSAAPPAPAPDVPSALFLSDIRRLCLLDFLGKKLLFPFFLFQGCFCLRQILIRQPFLRLFPLVLPCLSFRAAGPQTFFLFLKVTALLLPVFCGFFQFLCQQPFPLHLLLSLQFFFLNRCSLLLLTLHLLFQIFFRIFLRQAYPFFLTLLPDVFLQFLQTFPCASGVSAAV